MILKVFKISKIFWKVLFYFNFLDEDFVKLISELVPTQMGRVIKELVIVGILRKHFIARKLSCHQAGISWDQASKSYKLFELVWVKGIYIERINDSFI